jgi:hypothetical protein
MWRPKRQDGKSRDATAIAEEKLSPRLEQAVEKIVVEVVERKTVKEHQRQDKGDTEQCLERQGGVGEHTDIGRGVDKGGDSFMEDMFDDVPYAEYFDDIKELRRLWAEWEKNPWMWKVYKDSNILSSLSSSHSVSKDSINT